MLITLPTSWKEIPLSIDQISPINAFSLYLTVHSIKQENSKFT